MSIRSLEGLYDFLVTKADMPDFMTYSEDVNLTPIPSVEYRDKIRGALVGLAIGDAFGSHLEGNHHYEVEYINDFLKGEKRSVSLSITDDTEMTILFSESLIINQSFQPEDIANRFIRYHINGIGDTLKEFIINYRDRRLEWYNSGVESAGNGAAMRCCPSALINYGDYRSLKLMAGMQAAITHVDQMAIASSILHSIGVAYLINTPPFALREKQELLRFVELCSKGIKGIEGKLYRTRETNEIANLYTRISRDVKEAIDKELEIEAMHRCFGSGAYVLESLPFAYYVFLRNPNDFEGILKDCLGAKDTDTVASMALTLAGAYIGYSNIPKGYSNKLRNLEELLILADRLFELSLKNKSNNPYRRIKRSLGEERSQEEIHQLLWMGIKLNKEEEYEEAVKYFEDLIVKSPELKKNDKIKIHIIEAYEGLGNRLIQAEAYEEALKFFKKALIFDINHPSILCNLAIAYLNLDDLDKAERYARRAVEISPEYEVGKQVLDAIISIKKKSI